MAEIFTPATQPLCQILQIKRECFRQVIYIYWLVVWNIFIHFSFPNSWDDDPIWLIFFRGVGQPPTRLGGSSHEVGYKPNWSKDQPDFWKKQGYHLLTELDDPPSRKYIGKCIGKTIENSWHGHGTHRKKIWGQCDLGMGQAIPQIAKSTLCMKTIKKIGVPDFDPNIRDL